MGKPDHKHRRDFSTYVKDGFSSTGSLDYKSILSWASEWWTEISTYFDDAISEYPKSHKDATVLANTKKSIKVTYDQVAKGDYAGRMPTVIAHFLDTAYGAWGIANVTALLPVPGGYTREWTAGNDYLFVSTKLSLNQTDFGYLYSAMIQDMSSGTSTDTGSLRHKSSKATGNVSNLIWYTHQYSGNRLLGVSACDPTARKITVDVTGTVNSGVHKF